MSAGGRCAQNGRTVASFLACLSREQDLPSMPSIDEVAGTCLADLYRMPVTFAAVAGYLYHGRVDERWQFATDPAPCTAARVRITAQDS